MKPFFLSLIIVSTTLAQVVPTTPTKFETKGVGINTGTATVGITPQPKPPTVVRTTTYFSLSDARQWTSTDGKPLLAKLIAFEDLVIEQVKNADGSLAPTTPTLPPKPTVVKDGKVRLLVANQSREVPLDRLCKADRVVIETVQAGLKSRE